MRKVLLAAAILISTSTSAWAESAVARGSVSGGGDRFTYGVDRPTVADAIETAMSQCNQSAFNCHIETQFNSLCFALVFGERGGWAYQTAAEQNDANRAALYRCSRSGEACHVVHMFCDTTSERLVENQKLFEIYSGNFMQCQHGDDDACVKALTYPNITPGDQDNIALWRKNIAHDREAQQAIANLSQQNEGSDTPSHALAGTLVPGVNAQNTQVQQQEHNLHEAFIRDTAACTSYDLEACDRALGYAKITDDVRSAIAKARNMRIAFLEDRKQCEAGSAAACSIAIQSPALLPDERAKLQASYEQASPLAHINALASVVATDAWHFLSPLVVSSMSLENRIASQPAARTIVTSSALSLALAIAALLLIRHSSQTTGSNKASAGPGADFVVDPDGNATPAGSNNNRRTAQQKAADAAARQTERKQTPSERTEGAPAQGQDVARVGPPPPPPTDPVTARQALRLAWSYMDELHDLAADAEDPKKAADHRSTMALATKQLDIAWRADPTAVLEEANPDGTMLATTQPRMRALLLLKEAVTYMVKSPAKATALMQRATEVDPEFALAHQSLGIQHFDHRRKAAAVASLERALLLDPDNIDIIKALDRAQNLTATEAFSFRVGRATDTTMNAGITTYNSFIFVANIGIRAWNIFATTWNILMFPLRVMLRLFGVVDRIWK